MSLAEHLIELRRRLGWSAVAVLVGAIGGWVLAEYAWDALRVPILEIAKDHNATINYDSITSAFGVRLQIAIVLGVVISSPVWLYQLFAFIVPALKSRERKYTFGFVFSAIPMFLAGCLAGWVIFPHIVQFMSGFVPPEDASFYNANYYLDFALKLILAAGVAFVMPVFLVLLNFMGIIQGRTILKGWRWAILAITVFTAAATPAADVISMVLLAIPLIILYFATVLIAVLRDRAVARREAAGQPA